MNHQSIIPGSTGYKILEYIIRLSNEPELLAAKYENDLFIAFLIDRGYIKNTADEDRIFRSVSEKKRFIRGRGVATFKSTPSLKDLVYRELNPLYQGLKTFIANWRLDYIENYCTIDDLLSLIKLSADYNPLSGVNSLNHLSLPKLTFQEMLAKYFSGSKHTNPNSSLAKAINAIVGGEKNIDLRIANQALSILYPKEPSTCIVLCENINRIGAARHKNIEFWYCGGRNTLQLQYIPAPKLPIYYLFDWDYDGVSIYLHIKEKYFPNLKPIIPLDFRSLAVSQDKVKYHHSKWRNNDILSRLTPNEQEIVSFLIDKDSVIEEQKIDVNEFFRAEQL